MFKATTQCTRLLAVKKGLLFLTMYTMICIVVIFYIILKVMVSVRVMVTVRVKVYVRVSVKGLELGNKFHFL